MVDCTLIDLYAKSYTICSFIHPIHIINSILHHHSIHICHISHVPHLHSDERLEWEDFAQLPHGINQIRAHLETQDNVPLLVHLFTHSTDTHVLGMLDVMTEWGEGVMTLSNSSHASNYQLFNKVDYFFISEIGSIFDCNGSI